MCRSGLKKPLKMSVQAISFSAHADYPQVKPDFLCTDLCLWLLNIYQFVQTSSFLEDLKPPHVILVHGEATEMGRLKRSLEQAAAAQGCVRNVHTPRNTQPVHISCLSRRVAHVVGQMASKVQSCWSLLLHWQLSDGSNRTTSIIYMCCSHMIMGSQLEGSWFAKEMCIPYCAQMNSFPTQGEIATQCFNVCSPSLPEVHHGLCRIRTGTVMQRQSLRVSQSFSSIRLALEVSCLQ